MRNMFKNDPVRRSNMQECHMRICAALKWPHLRESLHTEAAMEKATLAAFVFILSMQGMAVVLVDAGKARVTVTNHLQQALRVSCESGDDVLGARSLQPKAVYAFAFTPNVWGNTLFWCSFDSDSFGRRTFRVWQGWLWASRRIACSECDWVVTPTGFACNGETLYSWRPW